VDLATSGQCKVQLSGLKISEAFVIAWIMSETWLSSVYSNKREQPASTMLSETGAKVWDRVGK
jgi:hypothetical protein